MTVTFLPLLRLERRLWVTCANGEKIGFPDTLLERAVNEACGLGPDRYIYADEVARLLGCARWKVWLKLMALGWPVLREDFLARFPPSLGGKRKAESV